MFYTLKGFRFKRCAALSVFSMFLSFSGNIHASDLQENEDLYGTCEKRLAAVRGMFAYTPTKEARKQNYTNLEQAMAPYVVRDYPAAKGNVYTFDARFNLLNKVMSVKDGDIKSLAYKGFEMEIAPSLKLGYRLSRVSLMTKKIEQKDPVLAALKNACVFDGSAKYLFKEYAQLGCQQKFTLSLWIRRDKIASGKTLGTYKEMQTIFATVSKNALPVFSLAFGANNGFYFGFTGPSRYPEFSMDSSNNIITDKKRWVHAILAIDTNSSKGQQVRFYVDGERDTSIKGCGLKNGKINGFARGQQVNGFSTTSYLGAYYDAYSSRSFWYFPTAHMTQIYGIDGQALGPEKFGKKVNDKWVPIDYTGAYGTNGFHLDFSDPSNLGKDSSGNNNHWTVSGPLKHVKL